jgi:pyrophosphatase PpaX
MIYTPDSIHAFLFDLDGTLLDSREVYWRASVEAFRSVLKKDPPPGALDQIMRMTTDDFLDLYAAGDQREALGMAIQESLERLFPQAKLFSGMEVVLPALKAAGMRTAVVTSQSRAETEASRQVIRVDAWIDVWVCADDVAHPKPDPEPIRTALARLRVAPGEAVMIGDTSFDLLSGRAAGTKTGLACWGAANVQDLAELKPDFLFSRPEDIPILVH